MNKSQRIEGAGNFFNKIYGKVEKKTFGYLWTSQDKETLAFDVSTAENRQAMAAKAIELSDKKLDVYFGVCLTDSPPKKYNRIKDKQVTLQTAIWTDIDCLGGKHIGDDKYPTIEIARQFLPVEPSMLICSGYGLHAYCVLDKPLTFAGDDERSQARERNQNFIDAIRKNAGKYATVVDSVGDLPRILRVPFTFNYKIQDSPVNVEPLVLTDKVFSVSEFDRFKPAETQKPKPSTKSISHSVKPLGEDFETARIAAALSYIDATPYDTWIRCGQALRSESDSYFDMWVTWSKTATNFKSEEDCRKHWQSFNGQGVSLSSIFFLAEQGGYNAKVFWKDWQNTHFSDDFQKSATSLQPKKKAKYADYIESDSQRFKKNSSKAIEKDVSLCYNDNEIIIKHNQNSTDGGVFSCSSIADNAAGVKSKGDFDTMDLISTKQAAELLGVTPNTLRQWRTRKIFGVTIFTADVKEGGRCFYQRERILQLKSVLQKGIVSNIYKLANLSDDEVIENDSQRYKADTPPVTQALQGGDKKKKYKDYYTVSEAAKILGVAKKTVDNWRERGIFLEDIVDHDGTYLYKSERVEQFARSRKPTDVDNLEGGDVSTTPPSSTDIPIKKKSTLPGVDFEYEVPSGYVLDASGLYILDSKKDKPTLKRICNPLIVSRRIVNLDDSTHKIELSSLQDKWIRATFSNSILTTKNKIPTVADSGFYDVTSNNAGLIVDYISRFIDTNRKTIPKAQSVSTVGWRGDQFVYPAQDGVFELDELIKPQVRYFTPKGNKDPLLALIHELKSIDNFNIGLGAALAAPIVGITGAENIVLHFWGAAGSGKTTLNRAIASIFVNPFETGAIPSANSTAAALEHFFNGRRDLPTLIEDFDSIDATDKRTQSTLRNLPYNFGNGIGRSRAKAQGGLRKTIEYRGTLITNGEQPLTSDNSKGGAKRRLIELECAKDMVTPKVAEKIDDVIRDNHACIGREWIQYIQDNRSRIIEKAKEIRKSMFKVGNKHNLVPRHMDILASIYVANDAFDVFAGFKDCCGKFETDCLDRIKPKLPSNDEISDVHRVKQFITDWILSHLDNLQHNEKGDTRAYECYGINLADCFGIYPTVMKKVLTDNGYAPSVLKQLADEGWLLHEKGRIEKRISTIDGRIYFIAIPKDNISGE